RHHRATRGERDDRVGHDLAPYVERDDLEDRRGRRTPAAGPRTRAGHLARRAVAVEAGGTHTRCRRALADTRRERVAGARVEALAAVRITLARELAGGGRRAVEWLADTRAGCAP